MKNHLLSIGLNFSAVMLLISLFASPIYFAKNFTQVAGIKSESPYLLVSQVGKFPGMTFTEADNSYSISFTKQAPSQAYLSILIINNPTNKAKTYSITNQSTENKLSFGGDLKDQQTKISVPPQSSVPISLLSQSTANSQSATFQIEAN